MRPHLPFILILAVTSSLLALCTPCPSQAQSHKFHYEPEKVQLAGVIERQTFPGRPGYESIKNGDDIERGWYLRLLTPIDVEETKIDADPNSSTERNVKVLQLTWESNQVEVLVRTHVGKKVTLSGHLFHALSGHHHSRVLLWVDSGEVIKK